MSSQPQAAVDRSKFNQPFDTQLPSQFILLEFPSTTPKLFWMKINSIIIALRDIYIPKVPAFFWFIDAGIFLKGQGT